MYRSTTTNEQTREAVLFSQTYKPSRAPEAVAKWKEALEKDGKGKVSRMIGLPPGVEGSDEDLFPEWEEYLRWEKEGLQEDLAAGDAAEKTGDQEVVDSGDDEGID